MDKKLETLLGKLATHHTVWIVDAAIRSFVDSLRETELNLLRATSCPVGLIYTPVGTKDRDPEHMRLMRQAGEYAKILDFLYCLKGLVAEASAETNAKAAVASILNKDNPPIDVKATQPKEKLP